MDEIGEQWIHVTAHHNKVEELLTADTAYDRRSRRKLLSLGLGFFEN